MKILHTGDVHFRGDMLGEIVKCTGFLLKKAQEISPDVVIIAGDLFDERQTYDVPTFIQALDFVHRLSEVAPVLIVKGTPSHDGRTLEFLRNKRVYVSERPEQVVLTGEGAFERLPLGETLQSDIRAVFSCLPSVSKAGVLSVLDDKDLNGSTMDTIELMRDVITGWKKTNDTARIMGIPTAMVSHLSVTGAMLSTGQQMVGREVELGVGDLRMSGASLVCLGHIHKVQHWGEIFYCGSITRLNFGEEEEKGFWLHTFEQDTLESSEFIETPARVMVTVNLDNPTADSSDLSFLGVPEGAFVRVRYEVTEEEVHSVDEEALRDALVASGAVAIKVEKTVRPHERVRAEGISKISSFDEKLRKWIETTGTDVSSGVFEKLKTIEKEMENENGDEIFVPVSEFAV